MIRKVKHLVRVLEGPLLGQVTQAMRVQFDTLDRFNRRVDRAELSAFWKRYASEAPHVISKMENLTTEVTGEDKFTLTGRIYSQLTDFSQDEINSFILDYRQFTQNNDPISVGNLSKIYNSEWVPDGARRAFEDARSQLSAKLQASTVLIFGDQTLPLSTLVDVVVYGGLAHANPEKAAVFEQWEKSGIMGFIWAEFFAYLRELMAILKFLRKLNKHLLTMARPSQSNQEDLPYARVRRPVA